MQPATFLMALAAALIWSPMTDYPELPRATRKSHHKIVSELLLRLLTGQKIRVITRDRFLCKRYVACATLGSSARVRASLDRLLGAPFISAPSPALRLAPPRVFALHSHGSSPRFVSLGVCWGVCSGADYIMGMRKSSESWIFSSSPGRTSTFLPFLAGGWLHQRPDRRRHQSSLLPAW